jgi:hypothetical protein
MGGTRVVQKVGKHEVTRSVVAPSEKVARQRLRGVATIATAFAVYLAIAVVWWWHAWSSHPSAVTSCACGDASLFLWFLEWPAYAIAHGHNPLYSTAMFHPAGINLLANTSVLGVGIVLSPVTWLFGPIATMNVASTLGPALSALGMFWLLRRWVSWTPAAFVGGLIFGFSPFVFVNVAGGHLMTSVLVLVPLIVACLDEILVRQQRNPLKVGLVLGVLVAAQFFISTEVLVIVAICSAAGVALLVAGAALDRTMLAARAVKGLRGLGAAALVAVVLLAYPVWFALDGPAHLSGLVWPTLVPGTGGVSLSNLWHPNTMTGLRNVMQVVGGYEGPALPEPEYLGLGMLLVIAVGMVAWRRDRRLWLLGGTGIFAVALSLGVNKSHWVPWNLLRHVPVVQNIIPGRFMIAATLCAAAMTAIVVDRTRTWVVGVTKRVIGTRSLGRVAVVAASVIAPVAALGVAAIATGPMGSSIAANVPLSTQQAHLPRWFAEKGQRLAAGQVVLTYPAPFTLFQSALGWQALDSLQFAMAGGGGPEGVPQRAGMGRAGMQLLSDSSFSLGVPPQPTKVNIEAIRQALKGWGVTLIVFPDPTVLPRYDQGTNVVSALGLFTVVMGRSPHFVDGAWVWTGVRSSGPALPISVQAFDRCTDGKPLTSSALRSVIGCVIVASSGDA